MLFPLFVLPNDSWKNGGREFGADRKGGKRKHAGCDLLAPIGTPIRAVKDGRIVDFLHFYLGTWAITIDHGDCIIRYGEVQSHLAKGLKVRNRVSEGDVIGYVGHLKGLKASMLHFELYSGTGVGLLTDTANKPFQRRCDLMDPTNLLDHVIGVAGSALEVQRRQKKVNALGERDLSLRPGILLCGRCGDICQ